MRREPASIPRRVARVRTEQSDGGVGHPRRITLAPGNFEERARCAGALDRATTPCYFFGCAFLIGFFALAAGFFALLAFAFGAFFAAFAGFAFFFGAAAFLAFGAGL